MAGAWSVIDPVLMRHYWVGLPKEFLKMYRNCHSRRIAMDLICITGLGKENLHVFTAGTLTRSLRLYVHDERKVIGVLQKADVYVPIQGGGDPGEPEEDDVASCDGDWGRG